MRSAIVSNAASLVKLHEGRGEMGSREYDRKYNELAFPGGLKAGLEKIAAGHLKTIEVAILMLELRPFYYRAQYQRTAITRLLKHQKLPPKLQARFDVTRQKLRDWRAAHPKNTLRSLP